MNGFFLKNHYAKAMDFCRSVRRLCANLYCIAYAILLHCNLDFTTWNLALRVASSRQSFVRLFVCLSVCPMPAPKFLTPGKSDKDDACDVVQVT